MSWAGSYNPVSKLKTPKNAQLCGFEGQRRAVDGIAPASLGGAVIKDITKVPAAIGAMDFRARQQDAEIDGLGQNLVIHGPEERRQADFGLIPRSGIEQQLVTSRAMICSFFTDKVQRRCTGLFILAAAQYGISLRREFLAPLRIAQRIGKRGCFFLEHVHINIQCMGRAWHQSRYRQRACACKKHTPVRVSVHHAFNIPEIRGISRGMKTILSIQSHVAYGHVGNAAAVFPLQRMGFEVVPVHTVQFSNHTGYGAWTGQVFSADHIRDVLNGLRERGVLSQLDAVLTGYLGDFSIGEMIIDVAREAGVPWCCDPVMGDVGRGFFVKDGIPEFFKQKALPLASIITPNQFELEFLTGQPITTLSEAQAACRTMHQLGVETVLLTSLIDHETQAHEIHMLASHKDGAQYMTTTPRLHFEIAPNGSGDATSAVFLGNLLSGLTLDQALEKTTASIFGLFDTTHQSSQRELALIAAQDSFTSPARTFTAIAL